MLLPALPWLAVALFVDAAMLRAQVEAAALRVTGRTLSLGHVTILNTLPLSFAAEDVTFANAPGGSRPDMLRIPYAEATLGILPLLYGRLEITSLVLSRPDLVLETDMSGAGNWQLATRPADLASGRIRTSPRPRWARRHAAEERWVIALEQLRIREGRLAWRNDAGAWTTVEVKRLDAAALGMEERGELAAQVLHAGHMVTATLNTGRLARLRDPTATAPWPLRLELETPGAHASIVGTLTHPGELRGYVLAVEGSAENLGDLDSLLPARLPPLRKLVFKTRLADSGGAMPAMSGISLRARESDLDSWVPGLCLDDLQLAADSFDQPVHVALDGRFDRQPLHLAASLGAPAALLSLGRVAGRMPVELDFAAAGGVLNVRGAIAAPERGAGLDLDLSGTMPDLGTLSPLLGFRLPRFRNITVGLHAGDAEGGFRQGLALRGIAIRSSEADLAGEVDLRFADRTPIRAVLTGHSLDIDALGAAIDGAAPPPGPAPGATEGGWLIPSDRLPLAGLARTDLDLRGTIALLQLGGTQFRDASVEARLHDGQLTIDPLTAALPGGGIGLKASLNVRARFPPFSLTLRATGMPARPVFGALGLPDDVTGTMSLIAGLRGAGASWHELASGLTGQVGFAMSDAEFDNRTLEAVFGPALRVAGLGWNGIGRTPARCLTLRLDARDGLATLRSLVLDTPSLLLQGDGALQLHDERVALRLRPSARASGQPAPIVRVGGVFTRTTVYTEQATLEVPSPSGGGLPPDICAEALATARAAVAGPSQP